MLIVVTLTVLNICEALCAADLQEAFDKLYSSAETRDLDAFKAIYEPLSPENQNMIAQNFILTGKRNADGRSALKFFIDYWYTNRPETALDDVYAKEAFSLLFPVFREAYKKAVSPRWYLFQESGEPSIHAIVTSGETSLLRLWIDAKMDVNTRNPGDQKTALYLAINMDNTEYVDLLIKAGANINACDAYGGNAFNYAWGKYADSMWNQNSFTLWNTNVIITLLLQKVTVTEACRVIAIVIKKRNNYALEHVLNEVHVSLVRQKLSHLVLTPSNENIAVFSTWSHRLRDFITIWDDLLKHLFLTPKTTVVMVHAAGGRVDYTMVSTISELHRLLTSGAATAVQETETTSYGCRKDEDVDMMIDIALTGSGILRPNRMGRIKVNRFDALSTGSVKFEVLRSGETPCDDRTTSGVAACAGGSSGSMCSTSNAVAQNRGFGKSGITATGWEDLCEHPVFPADPRVADELYQMFNALQIDAEGRRVSANSAGSSAAAGSVGQIRQLPAPPPVRVFTRLPRERSVPRLQEAMDHRSRSRIREATAQSRCEEEDCLCCRNIESDCSPPRRI